MPAFKQTCGVTGMSTDKQQTEHELYLEKVRAEINHLLAQTAKASKETKWYEIVIIVSVTVSVTLAIVAIVKLFL